MLERTDRQLSNEAINLVPRVLFYFSLLSELERKRGNLILCLTVLCRVHAMIVKVRKSEIDLLTLQL